MGDYIWMRLSQGETEGKMYDFFSSVKRVNFLTATVLAHAIARTKAETK